MSPIMDVTAYEDRTVNSASESFCQCPLYSHRRRIRDGELGPGSGVQTRHGQDQPPPGNPPRHHSVGGGGAGVLQGQLPGAAER